MKLLLDYDGVILKNPKLTKYQFNKSAMFVQKHIHLPIQQCEHFNKKYYPKYGHTVTMLNEMFMKPVTLEEYNDYVFNKHDLNKLSPLVCSETKKHARSFINLIDYCEQTNKQWYIFTNAHLNWVMHFSSICDLPVTEDKVIWPRNLSLLKPNKESYDNIEKMFPNDNYMFIDDSEVNLDIPRSRSKWIPIKFD